MTQDMVHVAEWHNGDKAWAPFSMGEMERRQGLVRAWMDTTQVDAVLFTSQHNIAWSSGWLYCGFGRKYGMILTRTASTTISAGVDGGQGWRRSFGGNVTYTDWRRDNFWRAIRQLTPGVQRLGLEFDHVSLDFRQLLEASLPGVEMVDVGRAAMEARTIKSSEELDLIRKVAAIADQGARAGIAAIRTGVAEYEVAQEANAAMTKAASALFRQVEPMEGWTWFQSGLNTDGAHNPVTNRRLLAGDILSLGCYPALFGYLSAVQRTLFLGSPDAIRLDLWQKNVAAHRRGLELIRPGARCNEIAVELNGMYRDWGLLRHRSYGYGHSCGILGRSYGREALVELREDVTTELVPGMVISLEPMVMLPEGAKGAGGYREQDVLIVTDTGAEVLSRLPLGPDHMVIG